jgi:hypothetical protein
MNTFPSEEACFVEQANVIIYMNFTLFRFCRQGNSFIVRLVARNAFRWIFGICLSAKSC